MDQLQSSDPGITLIELYAWMTELMLYRLNKVPEKNFLAFLELMGVRLEAPKAAQTVVQFIPKPTAGTVDIPAGTGLMTRAEGGARPIPFETTEERIVVNTAIGGVFSQVREPREGRTLIEDVTTVATGEAPGEFQSLPGNTCSRPFFVSRRRPPREFWRGRGFEHLGGAPWGVSQEFWPTT